jgi:hypothetical protein
MANWYGSARTNYVRVSDMEALKENVLNFGIKMVEKDGKVAFFPDDYSDGDFPYSMDDDEGNEIIFSWEDIIMPYIAELEVFVVMCCGAEKLRYITGDAQAYCRKGSTVQFCGVNLNDIFSKAALEFDVDITQMTPAEY